MRLGNNNNLVLGLFGFKPLSALKLLRVCVPPGIRFVNIKKKEYPTDVNSVMCVIICIVSILYIALKYKILFVAVV